MWPFKKKEGGKQVDSLTAAAVIMSALALVISIGVARWSWLTLDEQIQLRNDFMDLQNKQVQTGQQYEYWLNKLQMERKNALNTNAAAPAPAPTKK